MDTICSREQQSCVFGKAFQAALARRLTPRTTLHPDQLGHAIGMDGRTVKNWLRGSNQPSGAAVAEVVQFFASQGDLMILRELFGDVVEPLVKRNEDGDKALKVLKTMHELAERVA